MGFMEQVGEGLLNVATMGGYGAAKAAGQAEEAAANMPRATQQNIFAPGQLQYTDPMVAEQVGLLENQILAARAEGDLALETELTRELDNLRFVHAQERENVWDVPEGAPDWALGEVGRVRSMTSPRAEMVAQDRMGGLTDMLALARGEDSIARREAAYQSGQLERNIASQIASTPGGFNPAAARAGMMALGQGRSAIAGRTAAAAAAEKLQARQAYDQMAASMMGGERQWLLNREAAARPYFQLGLGDKAMRYGAKQDLERLKVARDQAIIGSQQGAAGAANALQQQATLGMMGWGQGIGQMGMSMLGGAAGSPAAATGAASQGKESTNYLQGMATGHGGDANMSAGHTGTYTPYAPY